MNELAQAYRSWVLAQTIEGCTLTENNNGGVDITGDLVKGWVSFYDIDGVCIVELRLERALDGEPAFFLHFELEDIVRAQNLFNEMAQAIYDTTHREVRHVLLCCSCGMTTTFFAMKLNEVSQSLGLDYEFSAQPIDEAKKNGADYAAVLLAPQVGYQRKDVTAALPETLVIELPGKLFGSYDAPGVLRLVVDALSGSRVSSGESQMQIAREYDRTKRILALSFVHREDEPTLSYRILDRGEIVLSGMLVRRSFDIQTLEDLAATLRVKGWKANEFDAIGLAVPGIVDKGIIVNHRNGEDVLYDLAAKLRELWGVKVYVDYNASAAAVGCYVSQEKYENVAFHAQAIGIADGEEGYVIEGRPLVGRSGHSGHLGALASKFQLGMDVEDAAWRVSGMRELVGCYLSSLACTIAPEVIYVWCDLLPDMDELREELEKTLPASAVPALVEVSDYDDCVLMGELALCLDRLK